jgi:hypothetical protein
VVNLQMHATLLKPLEVRIIYIMLNTIRESYRHCRAIVFFQNFVPRCVLIWFPLACPVSNDALLAGAQAYRLQHAFARVFGDRNKVTRDLSTGHGVLDLDENFCPRSNEGQTPAAVQ